MPGADKGFAVGVLYEDNGEDGISFESEPVYIGPAPNFMVMLRDADDYDDEEIDEKYREEGEDSEEAEGAEE